MQFLKCDRLLCLYGYFSVFYIVAFGLPPDSFRRNVPELVEADSDSVRQETRGFYPNFVSISSTEILWETEHDESCFTQGLEYYNATTLVESCGLYGKSKIQLVHLSPNGSESFVLHSTVVPSSYFLEGLTILNGNRLFVLTWRSHKVLEFSLPGLAFRRTYDVPHEGWGITVNRAKTEGNFFFMSDGSSIIREYRFYEEKGFIEVDRHTVNCGGRPVNFLNELEFVHSQYIVANVWRSTTIVVYDVSRRMCVSVLDAADIKNRLEKSNSENVLNGIAMLNEFQSNYGTHENSECTLLLTGKCWSKYYNVKIKNWL